MVRWPAFLIAALAALIPACAPHSEPVTVAARANPDRNVLAIAAQNALEWNGRKITHDQLAALLTETISLPNEPLLELRPDIGSDYKASAKALKIIKKSRVTKLGFVGNEKYEVPSE